MPTTFGLVIGVANADMVVSGGIAQFAALYRRDPTTEAFSQVLFVDTGIASQPEFELFTASPITTYQASVTEPNGYGDVRTDNGINWVNNGQAAHSRDPSNGDCFIGGNLIAKSIDNGLTYPTVLVTLADVTPLGYIGVVEFSTNIAVLDGYCYFHIRLSNEPAGSQHHMWRVATDGTGLEDLSWPDQPELDRVLIYASWATNRIWVWSVSHAGPLNISSARVWSIDTSLGTPTVDPKAVPPLSGRDNIGMILSTTNSRVLVHVIDAVWSTGGTHTGLAQLYESTDDGVTWTTPPLWSAGISGIPGCIVPNTSATYGQTLWQNPIVPSNLAMLHQVPNYYESIDGGATWLGKTFVPFSNIQFPHYSCIGFAALSDASFRRAGRTSTVVGAT